MSMRCALFALLSMVGCTASEAGTGAAQIAAEPPDADPRDPAEDDGPGEQPGGGGSCPSASAGWRSMAPPPYAGVRWMGATWTGSEMLAYGASVSCADVCTTTYRTLAYDPLKDSWRKLAAPPFTREFADAAVSGFVSGQWILEGVLDDAGGAMNGYSFDLAANVWTKIEPPPLPPRNRMNGTVASTGEVIVYGGFTSGADGLFVGKRDGAAWNVATRTWRTIPDAPFDSGGDTPTLWDGTRMIVMFPSSTHHSEDLYADPLAAAYDPVANVWVSLPAPPGVARVRPIHQMVGDRPVAYRGMASILEGEYPDEKGGVAFDPKAGTWTEMGEPALASFATDLRALMVSWSTSDKLFVWGGISIADVDADIPTYPNDGAIWDAKTNTWSAMLGGGPSGRTQGLAVYTGCDAIVFGGSGPAPTEGALYRP